jgi:transposase InsO family protein
MGTASRASQAGTALRGTTRGEDDCAGLCSETSGARHRELAWRIVDEDVAYLSPSTVSRIVKTANLVCPWRRRKKRNWEEEEKATRPNERWATDVMQIMVGAGTYFVVSFLDEYSRYLVHFETPYRDGRHHGE